jgi:uridine kinase/hypoxanthine phosphoribosyltransferase
LNRWPSTRRRPPSVAARGDDHGRTVLGQDPRGRWRGRRGATGPRTEMATSAGPRYRGSGQPAADFHHRAKRVKALRHNCTGDALKRYSALPKVIAARPGRGCKHPCGKVVVTTDGRAYTLSILVVILGVLGSVEAFILIRRWIEDSVIYQKVSWAAVYRHVDKFIKTFKNLNPQPNPDVLICLGYGGIILGVYIHQFFPTSMLLNIPIGSGQDGVRDIDLDSLEHIVGDRVLIIAGIHQTGWSVATASNAIRGRHPDMVIKSYAFADIPLSKSTEASEAPLATPDYASLRRRRVKVPWYVDKAPSTRGIGDLTVTGPTLTPTRTWVGRTGPPNDVRSLAIDLSGSRNAVSLDSTTIVNLVASFIDDKAQHRPHYNVVISGPGAVGKTHLARLLETRLPNGTYLPLDASVRDSLTRDAYDLDGYQILSYDITKVNEWIEKLSKEEVFDVSPYDHFTRSCHGTITVNGKANVRIIDWAFSLINDLGIEPDLRIVIDASEAVRYQFLYARFTELRRNAYNNKTLSRVKKRVKSARAEIDPTLSEFDLRFLLDSQRHIIAVDCKIPELSARLQDLLILK